MIALSLVPPADGAGQVELIARTFGVAWPHLIAQTISFTLVCALLYWLAYRPILRMLEERRQQIADGLANAAQVQRELAKTESLRQEVLVQAHADAQAIVRDARAAAAHLHAQQVQRSAAEAQDILARAHDGTLRERERMLGELRRDVGRLVVQTTAAVTGKVLTADDQRRLAEEAAGHLTS